MAPIDVVIPLLIPASIAAQVWPCRRPTMVATAVPKIRAIWFGPDEDSSPKSATEPASMTISATTGVSACPRVGALVVLDETDTVIPRGIDQDRPSSVPVVADPRTTGTGECVPVGLRRV